MSSSRKKVTPARAKTTRKAGASKTARKPALPEVRGKKAPTVDEFMAALDHPFKAEVQAVREIIKSVNRNIAEEVKWRAPSFSYKGYLATFNLWATEHVHLVFHNGAILDPKNRILEGEYPDRRMVYFANMDEVRSKKPALVKAVKEWIRLMDKNSA